MKSILNSLIFLLFFLLTGLVSTKVFAETWQLNTVAYGILYAGSADDVCSDYYILLDADQTGFEYSNAFGDITNVTQAVCKADRLSISLGTTTGHNSGQTAVQICAGLLDYYDPATMTCTQCPAGDTYNYSTQQCETDCNLRSPTHSYANPIIGTSPTGTLPTNGCINSCLYTFGGQSADGGTYLDNGVRHYYLNFAYYENQYQVCSDPDLGIGNETVPPNTCPNGQSVGSDANNQPICIQDSTGEPQNPDDPNNPDLPDNPNSPTPGQETTDEQTTNNPDGSTTTTTTTNHPDGSQTTTTTTTQPDGSSSSTTTTTGSPNSNANGGSGDTGDALTDFCNANPNSPFCGGGEGECTDDPSTPENECGEGESSYAAAACDSVPTCEGDAVFCAIALHQHEIECSLFVDPNQTLDEAAIASEIGYDTNDTIESLFEEKPENTIAIDSIINLPDATNTGSCPADFTFSAIGSTFTIPMTYLCQLATAIRPIVLASAYLSASFIIYSGLIRETA